jgi:tetratricopeptide (TPR) repeat protein
MHLLSGYPLILQVVLPNLAAKPAASVLSELQTGLAAIAVQNRHRSSRCATPGRLGERNTSRPERSERRLRVPIANPSVEVLRRPLEFALYAKELMAEPALAELPLARLGEVLETARGLGLLRRDEHNAVFLRPQPALAWFLTSRLAAPEQAARKAAIERAFRRLYDGYASALSQLQRAKEPEQRKLGFFLVEQEYTNLGTALRLALDQDESILGPYTVLSGHLDVLQDQRRGLELGETVLQALERRPSETMTGKRGADLVRVIDNIATRQLLAKRFEEAKASYEKALSIHDGLGDYTKQLEIGRAGILHRLGMVAQEQRRFEEAAGGYRKALEIKLAFDDRHSAASTYHQLGIVAQEQRHVDEAEDYTKRALEIFLAINDQHSAAIALYTFARLWRATGDNRIPEMVAGLVAGPRHVLGRPHEGGTHAPSARMAADQHLGQVGPVRLVLRLVEHQLHRPHDLAAGPVLGHQQGALAAGHTLGDALPEGLGLPAVERRHEADRSPARHAIDEDLGQGSAPFPHLLGRERADGDARILLPPILLGGAGSSWPRRHLRSAAGGMPSAAVTCRTRSAASSIAGAASSAVTLTSRR